MATSPIYNWPEPDNTDLVKNGALAIRTLGNAIDTTMATMVPKTIVDAKGDLIAGTAADTAARLAVGSNNQVLTADSSTATGLKWATPASGWPTSVACAVFNAGSNVTYVANTPLILNFTSEDFDTNTMHDNSTNTSRITIPTGFAGKYLINTNWRIGVGVGYVIIKVLKNGSAVATGLESGELTRVMNQGSNSFGLNGSVVLNLAVSDYVEMQVQMDVSGTNATYARFSATYLGA